MQKVIGFAFESASVKDNTSFTVKIKQIHIHGLGSSGKMSEVVVQRPQIERTHRRVHGASPAAKWPRHREVD